MCKIKGFVESTFLKKHMKTTIFKVGMKKSVKKQKPETGAVKYKWV